VSFRAQRICAWCGPLFLLFTGLGFAVIAGFIPPTPPSDTAQQVADRFLNDRNSIRGGLLLAMFGSTLLCPWYAITGLLLKRIAGRHTPWSATYLMAATVTVVAFLIPYMTWQTAAFRPDETSPELTQRLNDLGWIPWIGMASTAVLQGLLIAVVIFQDHREVPLMPRWAGYLSLLSATSLIPPTLLVFFKTGPFAWNGIAFYISLACYTTWIFALSAAMVKAINRLEREEVAVRSNSVAVADNVDVAAELAILRQQIKDLQEHGVGSPLPS
jgi:hypothetical protein